MSPLEHLLPPTLLRALGFTLLHSLWQGTLVGILAALLLLVLHRHAALVRYRVAGGALVLLLGLAGLTFGRYYTAGPVRAADFAAEQPASAMLPSSVATSERLAVGLHVAAAYTEQHLPLLVGTWLLGLVAMLLRLLGELAYVERLRRYRVAALPAAWQTWLDGLARQAGRTRRVQLLASALVTSPVVVGLWRPVVLLPLSVATGLPTPELEMILAHELAHVLRRDYLVNLLQSVAEMLFFYHPAVWFLARCLHAERENCCDDLAADLHGDARLLAQALAAVAELSYAARSSRLALAAAGPAGSLVGRVRRLVWRVPTPPTFAERFGAATVGLVGLGLVISSAIVALGAARLSATAPMVAVPPSAVFRPAAYRPVAPKGKVADFTVGQHQAMERHVSHQGRHSSATGRTEDYERDNRAAGGRGRHRGRHGSRGRHRSGSR